MAWNTQKGKRLGRRDKLGLKIDRGGRFKVPDFIITTSAHALQRSPYRARNPT